MSIDMNHTRHAPGQAVKPCPRCGGALVDTSDGVWAHAIGVEPCGGGDVMNGGGSGGSADSLQGFGRSVMTADEHLMLNLAAMDPVKRDQWEMYCSNVVLRSLLPAAPTDQELADAKRVLEALEQLRQAKRATPYGLREDGTPRTAHG